MHQRLPEEQYDKYDLMSANMGRPVVLTEEEPGLDGGDYHGSDEEAAAVDFLDDVFGSVEPEDAAAAATQPPVTAGTAEPASASASASASAADVSSHPSDMARLQQDHSTAGYRDGITAGKATSLQAGFDEGYTLGAALGSAAGELLGLLEGMAAAGSHNTESAQLLAQARPELAVRSIYATEYFAPDGTWTYEVAAIQTGQTGQTGHAEQTVLDVARAHPLIRKWRSLVDAQADRVGVVVGDEDAAVKAALGLQDEGTEGPGDAEGPVDTAVATRSVPASSTAALDW